MEIFSLCKFISIHFRSHLDFGYIGHEMHNFMNYCKTAEMGWKGDLSGRGEILPVKKPVTIRESKQV